MKMSTLYFKEGIFQNQNPLEVVFFGLVWVLVWVLGWMVGWLVGLGFGFFVGGGGFFFFVCLVFLVLLRKKLPREAF